MNLSGVLLLFLAVQCECVSNSTENHCLNVKTDLGLVRKRRHLTFPDPSFAVLTISLVKAFMTHAPSGWNIALEIDVLYPLPKEDVINRFYRRKLHHKQKRELWQKIQHALELYNINGHHCIIRGICEWKSLVVPPGKSLVYDLLNVVFTMHQIGYFYICVLWYRVEITYRKPQRRTWWMDDLIETAGSRCMQAIFNYYNKVLSEIFRGDWPVISPMAKRRRNTNDGITNIENPSGKSYAKHFNNLNSVLFLFRTSHRDEEFVEEMKGFYDFSDPNFCKRINDCPFSIVDFVLKLSKQ